MGATDHTLHPEEQPSGSLRRIWVTRELDASDLRLARRLGLEPVVRPAIRKAILPANSRLSIPEDAVWIFTSKNGVTGMQEQRSGGARFPEPRAQFAVGEQTAMALESAGYSADWPAEENATGLAHLILRWADLNLNEAERDSLKLVHWCGNRSRPELREVLERAGMDLKSIPVYRTELVRVQAPSPPLDAILFYSPSAVEAVRRSEAWPDPMPRLYAIGSTTGEVLSLESNDPVHIPSKSSTRALLELVARDLGSRSKDSNEEKLQS